MFNRTASTVLKHAKLNPIQSANLIRSLQNSKLFSKTLSSLNYMQTFTVNQNFFSNSTQQTPDIERRRKDFQSINSQIAAGEAMRLGKVTEAIKKFEEALEIQVQINNGIPSEEIYELYSLLSDIYLREKKLPNALKYAQKQLEEGLKAYANNFRLLADTNCKLGDICWEMNDVNRSIKFFEQALQYAQRENDPVRTFICQSNINSLNSFLTKPQLTPEGQPVITLMKGSQGRKSTDNVFIAAETEAFVGKAYLTRQDFQRAGDYYKKAIAFYETDSRYEDLLPQALGNLAVAYDYQCKHEDSLKYRLKMLPLAKKVYGEKSFNMGTVYNDIGVSYQQLGDVNNAAKYYEKGYEIYRNTLGEQHPTTQATKSSLADQYQQLREFEKAWKLSKELLETYKKSGEKHDLKEAKLLLDVGTNQLRLNDSRSEGSDEVLKRALEIGRTLAKCPPALLFNSLTLLGEALEAKNQKKEALALFQEALSFAEKVSGKGSQIHQYAQTCIDNLAQNSK